MYSTCELNLKIEQSLKNWIDPFLEISDIKWKII